MLPIMTLNLTRFFNQYSDLEIILKDKTIKLSEWENLLEFSEKYIKTDDINISFTEIKKLIKFKNRIKIALDEFNKLLPMVDKLTAFSHLVAGVSEAHHEFDKNNI